MRRKIKTRKTLKPDSLFGSVLIEKFINQLMLDGEKSVARRVMYKSLDEVKKKAKVDDPAALFESAIKNVSPTLEVVSRRVGGANYQVPKEVRADRKTTLAIRWILAAVRTKKGGNMPQKLAEEFIAASKNEGAAIKKKDDTHRMAESNRAFAHFAW